MDFHLITDSSIPAVSGLGAGTISGILIGATVAAALAGFWFLGRRHGRPEHLPGVDPTP